MRSLLETPNTITLYDGKFLSRLFFGAGTGFKGILEDPIVAKICFVKVIKTSSTFFESRAEVSIKVIPKQKNEIHNPHN